MASARKKKEPATRINTTVDYMRSSRLEKILTFILTFFYEPACLNHPTGERFSRKLMTCSRPPAGSLLQSIPENSGTRNESGSRKPPEPDAPSPFYLLYPLDPLIIGFFRLDNFADDKGFFIHSRNTLDNILGRICRDHRDQADTIIKRPPHLQVFDISGIL